MGKDSDCDNDDNPVLIPKNKFSALKSTTSLELSGGGGGRNKKRKARFLPG